MVGRGCFVDLTVLRTAGAHRTKTRKPANSQNHFSRFESEELNLRNV